MNHIKKVIICILPFVLLSLAGCGTEDKTNISTENESVIQGTESVSPAIRDESAANTIEPDESKEIENIENLSEQSSFDRETEQVSESDGNNYKSILLGNANFICTDLGNKSLNIGEIGQAVTDDDSVTVNATKFAVIDLDGDGEDEVILWIQINGISDYGFEVLHCQDGEFYGFTLPYRAFMNLKTDGTFTFSNGGADTGIGKMTFSAAEYSTNNLIYSQSEYDSNNELAIQYFIDGESCSEDEFNDALNNQEQKTDVKWYDLSESNINA